MFCHDLPEIMQSNEGEIEMFTNDTTIYAIGPNPDCVASMLNEILYKLSRWCLKNLLTAHRGKIEYMLLGCACFIGPLQHIKLGETIIKLVSTKICLA